MTEEKCQYKKKDSVHILNSSCWIWWLLQNKLFPNKCLNQKLLVKELWLEPDCRGSCTVQGVEATSSDIGQPEIKMQK